MTALATTDLFTLEQRAWDLKEALIRDWVALADVLKTILKTDKWREGGYKNRRDYCDERLRISYEYCMKIMRGAVASQQVPQLAAPLSVDAANELSKIEPAQREQAVKTVVVDGRVTASKLKAYRVISSAGQTPTPKAVVEFLDGRVECGVKTLIAQHSDPPGLLRKLLQDLEGYDAARQPATKTRMDAKADSTRARRK